jgi:transcription antitermination factor NusG
MGLWIAAQVRSKSEFAVCSKLRDKGYETFLPTYLSVRQWSDRKKVTEQPLISGYVFVKMVPDEAHGPVVTTDGVTRLVGYGGRAGTIEDWEIESLRKASASSLKAEPWEYMKEGAKVRITGGALAGAVGTVLQARNKLLLVLSVHMLNRSVAVHIDRAWVQAEPVEADKPVAMAS